VAACILTLDATGVAIIHKDAADVLDSVLEEMPSVRI
jgi:hypothetical protein